MDPMQCSNLLEAAMMQSGLMDLDDQVDDENLLSAFSVNDSLIDRTSQSIPVEARSVPNTVTNIPTVSQPLVIRSMVPMNPASLQQFQSNRFIIRNAIPAGQQQTAFPRGGIRNIQTAIINTNNISQIRSIQSNGPRLISGQGIHNAPGVLRTVVPVSAVTAGTTVGTMPGVRAVKVVTGIEPQNIITIPGSTVSGIRTIALTQAFPQPVSTVSGIRTIALTQASPQPVSSTVSGIRTIALPQLRANMVQTPRAMTGMVHQQRPTVNPTIAVRPESAVRIGIQPSVVPKIIQQPTVNNQVLQTIPQIRANASQLSGVLNRSTFPIQQTRTGVFQLRTSNSSFVPPARFVLSGLRHSASSPLIATSTNLPTSVGATGKLVHRLALPSGNPPSHGVTVQGMTNSRMPAPLYSVSGDVLTVSQQNTGSSNQLVQSTTACTVSTKCEPIVASSSLTTDVSRVATLAEVGSAISAAVDDSSQGEASTVSETTCKAEDDVSPSGMIHLSDDEAGPNNFFAALMQLNETNKKADAEQKAKMTCDPVPVSSSSSSVGVLNIPTLPSASQSPFLLRGPSAVAKVADFSLVPKLPAERPRLGPSNSYCVVSLLNGGQKIVPTQTATQIMNGSGTQGLQSFSLGSGSSSFPTFIVNNMAHKMAVGGETIAMPNQFRSQIMAYGGEPEIEEEEVGPIETYAVYKPSKLAIGSKHPDTAVESASLSSVEPPNIDYHLAIPSYVISEGLLSSLQLETVHYACQKHEKFLTKGPRVGYLVGDGAGVGKGRTIAAIIYENFLQGRKKALWFSVSNDLYDDAIRDLTDIDAKDIVKIHLLSKLKYNKISSKVNGKVKDGIIFSTYSSLIGESKTREKNGKRMFGTRMEQLIHWLGKDFDGVIVFDECHRAKNSEKGTKTGKKVVDLQDLLPDARIIYSSATGATEPSNMAYMVRLGLWGDGCPFKDFSDFLTVVRNKGVGVMELVAMEMKQRGTYIARQLSFHGVAFHIEEVQISEEFTKVYNESVRLWVRAKEYLQEALDLVGDVKEGKLMKKKWSQFWSSHQRFFKYLCIAGKVEHCVKLADQAIQKGKSVVIGLQSTGESLTAEQFEEQGSELDEFVSTIKGVFQKFVENHFPSPDSLELSGSDFSLQCLQSKKRKREETTEAKNKHKRYKKDENDCHNSDSGSDSSSDDGNVSDELSEAEDEDEDDLGSASDTNPFANGSEDESEPWVVRKKEKKLSKKKKQKKPVNKSSRKRKSSFSEDEFCNDFEEQAEKAMNALSQRHMNTHVARMSNPNSITSNTQEILATMKRDLLQDVERLQLPTNTLDELIERLGGEAKVAEMTGRKNRLVKTASGSIQYVSRAGNFSLENINNIERQAFMDGDKKIAIISEAASTGISLHADRRAKNCSRRVHITLELPWSADRAIQQFGRTHRSNQMSPPEYVFLISNLAGERRFAATVAKRLESLGALTQGDRRATETRDLSQFNIDNDYGKEALNRVMKSVTGIETPLVKPPSHYKGNFFEDIRKALVGVGLVNQSEKDQSHINKFLNRILGLEVEMQNALFQYFTGTLDTIISTARKSGHLDIGIRDLSSTGDKIVETSSIEYSGNFCGPQTKVRMSTIVVEGGSSWSFVENLYEENEDTKNGFYKLKKNGAKQTLYFLAIKDEKESHFRIYRPYCQPGPMPDDDLKNKYIKVTGSTVEVQHYWEEHHEASLTMCSHQYQFGFCTTRNCSKGKRMKTYHILSGSVLSAWPIVERVMKDAGAAESRLKVVRLKTCEDKRIIGTIIETDMVDALSAAFQRVSESSKRKSHDTLKTALTSTRTIDRFSSSTNLGQENPVQQEVLSMPSFDYC